MVAILRVNRACSLRCVELLTISGLLNLLRLDRRGGNFRLDSLATLARICRGWEASLRSIHFRSLCRQLWWWQIWYQILHFSNYLRKRLLNQRIYHQIAQSGQGSQQLIRSFRRNTRRSSMRSWWTQPRVRLQDMKKNKTYSWSLWQKKAKNDKHEIGKRCKPKLFDTRVDFAPVCAKLQRRNSDSAASALSLPSTTEAWALTSAAPCIKVPQDLTSSTSSTSSATGWGWGSSQTSAH